MLDCKSSLQEITNNSIYKVNNLYIIPKADVWALHCNSLRKKEQGSKRDFWKIDI